jgi:WD40 repeat protein
MSGFRSIHREQVSSSSLEEESAIWCVQVTSLLQRSSAANHLAAAAAAAPPVWRIWTANSDGSVRSYTATEASHSNTSNTTIEQATSAAADAATVTTLDTLTASAIQLHCTHGLVGGRASASSAMLGCTQLCTIRNYIGEDDTAGDLVVLALGLSGTCRVWVFTDDWDDHQAAVPPSLSKPDAPPPRNVPCLAEFTVDNATGTTMAARVVAASWQTIVVAVGCLDGTIAIVDTGIATASTVATAASTKDTNNEGTAVPTNTTAAGTLLEYVVATDGFVCLAYCATSHTRLYVAFFTTSSLRSWGTAGSAIPLRLAWHPTRSDTLVVSRQDGVVDVLFSASSKSSGGGSNHKSHRLLRLVPSPSRAVAFTPDGALLIAGNDNGMICVWDMSGSSTSASATTAAPILVHHVLRAHTSWILNMVCLPDSRRFVTVGAERQVHVWNVGQLTAPLHTFQLDSTAWTLAIPSSRVSTKPPHNPNHAATRMVTGSDSGWLQVFSLAS